MATFIEQAVAEVQDAIAVVEPVIAGDTDLSKIDLDGDTARAVNAAIAVYARRLALLQAVLSALTNLIADGYPNLPMQEVSVTTLKTLQEEVARIEAALAKFESNEATSIEVHSSPPQPK